MRVSPGIGLGTSGGGLGLVLWVMDGLGMNLPDGVLIGLGILAVIMVVGGVWIEVRAHRQPSVVEPSPPSPTLPQPTPRRGYVGSGGATADLSHAQFGKSLDIGIDNADEGSHVDASHAEFATDEDEANGRDEEEPSSR